MAVGLKLVYGALELAIMLALITSNYARCTESAVMLVLLSRGDSACCWITGQLRFLAIVSHSVK